MSEMPLGSVFRAVGGAYRELIKQATPNNNLISIEEQAGLDYYGQKAAAEIRQHKGKYARVTVDELVSHRMREVAPLIRGADRSGTGSVSLDEALQLRDPRVADVIAKPLDFAVPGTIPHDTMLETAKRAFDEHYCELEPADFGVDDVSGEEYQAGLAEARSTMAYSSYKPNGDSDSMTFTAGLSGFYNAVFSVTIDRFTGEVIESVQND